MKKILSVVAVFLIILARVYSGGAPEELSPGLYAEIETNRGSMIFQLDVENVPLTVTNFCGLAEGSLPNDAVPPGTPYYDGQSFYRVVPQYAVFSGDPTSTGEGGPGYTITRERNFSLSTGASGILVMDGLLSESAGSRFFITIDGDEFLNKKYTPFGKIVEGMDVLKKLKQGDSIKAIKILRVGSEAESLQFNKERFDEYLGKAKKAELDTIEKENPLLAQAIINLGDAREKTSSGIFYAVLNAGADGEESPGYGDRVSIHYTASLLDGTVFDSSYNRGNTFDFILGEDSLIAGWVQMVREMRPGEKRRAVIPPYLAYGETGYGPIKPNSWLVFEMELIEFSRE